MNPNEGKIGKKEEKIKIYIRTMTNGLVNLKAEHLAKIMEIATEPESVCKVQLYKRDFVRDGFELMRTQYIRTDKVMQVLEKTKGKSVEGFYRFDVYDENEKFITQIFTVNSNLFF